VRLPFDPPDPVEPGDIQAMLENEIADGGLPGPDAGANLYMYYPPRNVTVALNGGGPICGLFAGRTEGAYHWETFDDLHLAYAVVPTCRQTDGGYQPPDRVEFAASHEFSEAITDPLSKSAPAIQDYHDAGEPWVLVQEVADRCADLIASEGGHTFQRVWSNDAARAGRIPCVPAPGVFPIGVTTLTPGQLDVDAGTTYDLVLETWASWQGDPWTVDVDDLFGDFPVSITPASVTVDGGQQITFHVTIPPGTAGQGVLLMAHSRRGDVDVSAWPVELEAH
jgi:hypothetical protein